jgi:hypothetical protein
VCHRETKRPAKGLHVKPFRPAYWLSAAERLADIERGLQRLASEDWELTSVIVGVYFPTRSARAGEEGAACPSRGSSAA